MRIHLINPSDVSFGIGVITPRWLYVLAEATPRSYGDPMIVDETLERLDPDTIEAGDIVGIGIPHRQRAARLQIGTLARERGAQVVFGGIHATLFPEEAHKLGGAHAVVKGDGDLVWAKATRGLRRGRGAAGVRRRTRGARVAVAGAVGSDASQSLHVGVGADGARLPEALLVLLGLEDRRPASAPARERRRHRRDRRAAAARLPLHRARRRQLLPGDAHRPADGRRGAPTRRSSRR